jgi:alcohol dehydrogenase (NADP+)
VIFVSSCMFFPSRLLPTAFLTTALSSARRNQTNSTTCLLASQMSERFPIGLGTYEISPDKIGGAIQNAIHTGYRRIDCAPVYFNEDKIGDALASELSEGSVARKDLYIVSKLACPFHRKDHVKIALQKTLNDLRLDYLDLFLIHWPQAFHYVDIDPTNRGWENEDIDEGDGGNKIDPSVSVHETWKAMEALVDEGLVKSIGVSNFPVSLLHELMTQCRIPPAVNQVESHPYLQQTKLLDYCNKRGVHFQAYSPLGTPGFKEPKEPTILEDPVLKKIAATHNVSVAVVCLTWAIQRGTSVVVKSASPERQRENWQAHGSPVELSASEMEEIASLDRGYRFFRPEDWWGSMGMAVFD